MDSAAKSQVFEDCFGQREIERYPFPRRAAELRVFLREARMAGIEVEASELVQVPREGHTDRVRVLRDEVLPHHLGSRGLCVSERIQDRRSHESQSGEDRA